MSLRNNTTIPLIGNENETAFSQQNSTQCVFVDSPVERISQLCAYWFFLLGSFFGNTLIVIIVFRHRNLRKTINYFIVNMAVSDLLYSLVVIPVFIVGYQTDSWHWRVSGTSGSMLCKLFYFSSSASLLVSVQSLVWIAIDRFVAVVFPIKMGFISSKIRAVAIVSTWVLALVFYFPWLVISGLVEQGNHAFCVLVNMQSLFFNEEAIEGYYWLHVIIRCLAPLLLITVLYTAIMVSLKRQSKAFTDAARCQIQRVLKKRRQATQMAVVIIVLFYICVIPYNLSRFVHFWKPSCAFLRTFYSIAAFMLFLSSVVNPIICLSFVNSYRRGLRNIVCYFCKLRNQSNEAKRERITLKEVKTLRGENCQ